MACRQVGAEKLSKAMYFCTVGSYSVGGKTTPKPTDETFAKILHPQNRDISKRYTYSYSYSYS